MLAVWWAAVMLFVVLWLVLSDLVSLVLPESLADMDSTLLPVFCSLTVSLTPLGLLARTVLSLLQMTYSGVVSSGVVELLSCGLVGPSGSSSSGMECFGIIRFW